MFTFRGSVELWKNPKGEIQNSEVSEGGMLFAVKH